MRKRGNNNKNKAEDKMYAKKQHNKNFIRRPDFNTIANLYDVLLKLTNDYGFEQVILHLGEVARTSITRDLASKIWGILNVYNKDKRASDDD